MREKGMLPESPVLVRIFKMESELGSVEDRPLGGGVLTPISQFYLSYKLGYPNKLESALGDTGKALMVHGACSSSGRYALMGVGEISLEPLPASENNAPSHGRVWMHPTANDIIDIANPLFRPGR